MTQGRLIAVVGPSGVGKDSVIDALCLARPDLHRIRRVITRDKDLVGEDFEPVTNSEFDSMSADDMFMLQWSAHALQYGIRSDALRQMDSGQDCIVNLSRSVLAQASRLAPNFTVLSLTASPRVLRHRLADRARETEDEIAGRMRREAACIPADLKVVALVNDGALQDTVQAALTALYPVRAKA